MVNFTKEKKSSDLPPNPKDVTDMSADGKEEPDPWALTEISVVTVRWHELSTRGKVKRVLWEWIGKFVLLLLLLYLFICSLDFLSSAFKLLGGKTAGRVFRENDILKNPICGLMIGVLVTVLVQSSSTSTSIVISMVGAHILQVDQAVYIIMGANIGTSVTNTIVSMAQAGNRDEFRRAFGGATVHDMFNWLAVIVLLPLEAVSGYLVRITGYIVNSIPSMKTNKAAKRDLLKVITKPFTGLFVQINKHVITDVALDKEGADDMSIVKHFCVYNKTYQWVNKTVENTTLVDNTNETISFNQTLLMKDAIKIPLQRCKALFSLVTWKDEVVGALLLIIALIILCTCLILIVKLLHSILKGKIAIMTRRIVNADFPGCFRHFTGYVAIFFGAGMTILVQSSSIFTSALTPLVGVGVISLERMYPLTLGANIGTTATGILAALAGDDIKNGLQLALCHLFFNISGILLWYPIPFMRKVPITLAKGLGNTTAKYRWFALFYIILMFFAFPAVVFALSIPGWYVLLGVAGPFVLILVIVIIINVLQGKRPGCLPRKLRTWNWLPLPLHSLRPLDGLIQRVFFCKCCNSLMQRGQVSHDETLNGVVVVDDTLPADKSLSHENKAYDLDGTETAHTTLGSENKAYDLDGTETAHTTLGSENKAYDLDGTETAQTTLGSENKAYDLDGTETAQTTLGSENKAYDLDGTEAAQTTLGSENKAYDLDGTETAHTTLGSENKAYMTDDTRDPEHNINSNGRPISNTSDVTEVPDVGLGTVAHGHPTNYTTKL